jgi:hypothetical protein
MDDLGSGGGDMFCRHTGIGFSWGRMNIWVEYEDDSGREMGACEMWG